MGDELDSPHCKIGTTLWDNSYRVTIMLGSGFLYSIPLGVLGLIAAAIALLSVEVGWRLGYRRHRRSKEESSTPISAAVGATMGLLDRKSVV